MSCTPPLHLYFRNPDGSLTGTAWWTLGTVAIVWLAWGLTVMVWPRWVLERFGLHIGTTGVAAMRVAGLAAGMVGLVVAILVWRTVPGKLY